MKTTEIGKSYWDNTGVYQQEYDSLYAKLVPAQGIASTLHGELIRAISRLFYEYCNNGNCNACEVHYEEQTWGCGACGGSGIIMEYDVDDEHDYEEECYDCGGSGEDSEEVESGSSVNSYYSKFLDLIRRTIPSSIKTVCEVETIITSNLYSSNDQFSDERVGVYNKLCDIVIFYVLTTQDKPLPIDYKD